MAVPQDVERRIDELSPSMFQQLGDAYLLSKDRNKYAAFLRIGTKLGKDKTTKGTPDTLVYTYDKKYLFVEYSTNSTDEAKKLIADIDKNIRKYNINLLHLSEIILFTNYKLNPTKTNVILDYASAQRVNCTIIDEGTLALEIVTLYPHLANPYLGIPIDTGQVVSLETFIKEYQRKSGGIATPLDNTFLFREGELERVINGLEENDFVILKGYPGVGKTKLAIEAISAFQDKHTSYYSFAISYKDSELLSDLTQNIHPDYDCIIFVDDANTIEKFKQIKGFYERNRIGKIKILITVRTHALNQVKDWCMPNKPIEVLIEPLENSEIETIVSESCCINNTYYLKRISQIAKGNPRIAIMIGKLAKEGHSIKSIENVTEVFDLYFSTIFKDSRLTKDVLKVAGIVSFSRFIDCNNIALLKEYLLAFNIDFETFNKAKDILNDLEIIDVPIDGFVKMGEQNLCTYFIYRVFIKDRLLDFATLFNFMSVQNMRLYRDKIYSVDIVCGREILSSIVRLGLIEYLKKHNTEKDIISIYKHFFVYFIDEIIVFVYNHFKVYEYSDDVEFDLKYGNFQFISETDRDPFLELNALIWKYSNNFDMSFELALDSVNRCPHLAPQLAYHIEDSFSVTRQDISICGHWQKEVVKYLKNHIEENPLCKHVLWLIARLFLKTFLKENVWEEKLRNNIWELLQKHYTEDFLSFIENYMSVSFISNQKTALFDKQYIFSILYSHMSNNNIKHCIIVQNYIKWAKSNRIYDEQCDAIKLKYNSDDYSLYSKLKWDSIGGNDSCYYDGYDNYCQQKALELKNSFLFDNGKDAEHFFDRLIILYSKNIFDKDQLCHSLCVIVDHNIHHNIQIGFLMLGLLLKNNIAGKYGYLIIHDNLAAETYFRIWDYIKKYSFDEKIAWMLQFLYNVPSTNIKEIQISYFMECLKHSKEIIRININSFLRLDFFTNTILRKFLDVIYNLNVKGHHIEFIHIGMDELFNRIEDNDYLFKNYIQQCIIARFQHFDYEKVFLRKLVERDQQFLKKYILESKVYWKESSSIVFYNMDFIWEMEIHNDIASMILNLLLSLHLDNNDNEELTCALFTNKNEKKRKVIQDFIMHYFHENMTKFDMSNLVVFIVSRYYPNILPLLVKDFILTNQGENFFNIDWTNTRRLNFTTCNTTYYDVIAERWGLILDIINTIADIHALVISNEIKRIIDDAQKRAVKERALIKLDRYS